MDGFRYKHGDRPLEGYTIQRAVGRGGFGEVYYAVSDAGQVRLLPRREVVQHTDSVAALDESPFFTGRSVRSLWMTSPFVPCWSSIWCATPAM